jgi:hypothetical protein
MVNLDGSSLPAKATTLFFAAIDRACCRPA